jgi:hypothetical protein
MNAVRYFFGCAIHDGCGNAPVRPSTEADRRCPACDNAVEVWIGTHAPPQPDLACR